MAETPDRFYIHCPCGNEILCTHEQIGDTITCFKCDARVLVETPPEGPEPPQEVDRPERDLKMEAHLVCIGRWLQALALWEAILSAPRLVPFNPSLISGSQLLLWLQLAVAFHLGHGISHFSRSVHPVALLLALLLFLSDHSHSSPTDFIPFYDPYVIFVEWLYVYILGFAAAGVALGGRAQVVYTPEYLRRVKSEPDVRPAYLKSPFAWLPLGLVAFIWLARC